MVKSWRCNLAMQKGQIWDRNRQFYTEKCERCLLQIVFWVEMLRLVVIPHYTADSAAEISLKRSARRCGTLLCARQFFHPDLSLRLRIFLCRCTLISPRRSRTVFFLGLKSIQLSHASNGNRPLSTIFGMTVHLLSRFVWCFPLSEWSGPSHTLNALCCGPSRMQRSPASSNVRLPRRLGGSKIPHMEDITYQKCLMKC